MTIQYINISYPEVFRHYSQKYKIFRELYGNSISALELREMSISNADILQKIILDNKEICYKTVENDTAGLLILGDLSLFNDIAKQVLAVGNEDFGHRIKQSLHNYSCFGNSSFTAGNKSFPGNKSYIMGILNVTPDSFSDGGTHFTKELAVAHAMKMLDEGADIIDIGGESTRPGSEGVNTEEEIKRIIPVIKELMKIFPDTTISVDTTKSQVARAALDCGATIINDISGLTFEPEIVNVIKEYNAVVIIMHIKGTPRDMQRDPYYDEVVSEVYDFLNKQVNFARKSGIKSIVVDPGIGFGKRINHNYELLKRLDEFKTLGYPILAGVSRKSFIGRSLGLAVDERDTATSIIEALSIKNGANIIRTHNVKNAVQAREIVTNFVNPGDIVENV